MPRVQPLIAATVILCLLQGIPTALQADPLFSSEPSTWSAGVDPRAVAAADTNGDGLLHLVVANTLADQYSLLKNEGPGAFPDRRKASCARAVR